MRGPQVILSRVNNEFLRSLFELEVPEIYEKVIEIRSIAREPGERAKVAVYSSDERIDPVGACVGIKGVRVQAIVRELNNERIDIVPYSSNAEIFVTRALAPAKVSHIDMFDDEHKLTVAVDDEKLSLAIGRNGQNARLASKLTGWKINIMSETEYSDMKKREAELLVPVGQLEGVGEKLEERLSEAGISSIQRLSQATVETLIKIDGVGEKSAETLIERAKEMVVHLEKEYKKRKESEAREAKENPQPGDEKLTVADVFEEDDEYVTEQDEQLEVTAPEVHNDEEDDASAKKD